MGIVHLEHRDGQSLVISLTPAHKENFKVRTITVVDESLSPVWMVIADNVAVEESDGESGECSNDNVEIRGSEMLLETLTVQSQAATAGRQVETITFGQVPHGFVQLLPKKGQPVARLISGKVYHVFVYGSESGASEVRM